MDKKKVAKLTEQCLDELYRNSEPPITWKEVNEKYSGKDLWWRNHKIVEATYTKIVDKYARQIPKAYLNSFYMELLNYAPMGK